MLLVETLIQGYTECVLTAVAKSGSCLLPVTSSTRVLELAMFLDAYWTQNQIKAPLLWVSHVAEKVRDSAKTMIEWCGDNVAKIFESTKETPFDFKSHLPFYRNATRETHPVS